MWSREKKKKYIRLRWTMQRDNRSSIVSDGAIQHEMRVHGKEKK